MGPGQPRDRVEEDDDVRLQFDQTFGPLQRQFRHLGVFLGGAVERRVDDLTLHRPLHVGDLLGPLVDQHHHQVALRVVGGDRLGDLLEHRGLPRLWGRHDQASLSLSDRGDEVDDPGEHPVGFARHFETEPLVGEQRGQVLELGAVLGLLGRHPVDRLHPHQGRELLLRTGSPNRTGDEIPLAEAELADLRGRNVNVLLARYVPRDPQEAVTLRQDVEQAFPDLQLLLGDVAVVAVVVSAAAAAPLPPTSPAFLARRPFLGVVVAFGLVLLAGRGRRQLDPGIGLGRVFTRLLDCAGLQEGADDLRLLESVGVDPGGGRDLA